MILEHVVLHNVRTHKHTEIVFELGTTLFSGDVGSGKSSILMGVEFALFGLGPQKAEALLSKGARDGYVELAFTVDGESYEIRRSLKRQASAEVSAQQDSKGSYLSAGGQKEPLSTLEMKQRVLRILRFNEPAGPNSISRIFRYAVFTPQEEMKVVLSDPKNRLETVRRAFGIEDYKIAADNAKTAAAEMGRLAAGFEGRAAGMEKLASGIKDLEVRIRDSEEKLEEARRSAGALKRELDSLLAEREKLKAKEAEKSALERRLAAARANISEKAKRRDSLEAEIAKDEKEIAEASGQIGAHRVPEKPTEMTLQRLDAEIKRLAGVEKELAEARARSVVIDEEIAAAESEMGGRAGADPAALEAEAKDAGGRAEGARAAQKEAQGRAREAEYEARRCRDAAEQIAGISPEELRVGAKCPTCENVITGEHLENLEKERAEQRAGLERKASEAGQLRAQAEADAEKSRAEAESLEAERNNVARLVELAARRSAKVAEREKTKRTIARLKGGRSLDDVLETVVAYRYAPDIEHEGVRSLDDARVLRTRLAEYEGALRTLGMLEQRLERAQNGMKRRRQETESVESELAAAESEASEAASGLGEFSGLDEKVKAADGAVMEKQELLTNARSRVSAEERGVNEGRATLERDKISLAEAERCAEEQDKYRDYATWTNEFFVRAMPEIEKKVLMEMYGKFNGAYLEWYKKIVDDETKRSYIDEDFAPRVEQDGFLQDVAYMSGGERTGVALAYRLALNSVLREQTENLKSGLLILDEPTDGFSDAQISKVKEMLGELDSKQIILVSHDPNLEGCADRVIEVERDGEVSRVRVR